MKKKILLVILAIIFIAINPVFAARKGAKTVEQLDEVVLETPEEQTDSIEVPQSVSITEQRAPEEKTLKEKLQDVYHLEVEKYDKPTYLLEDSTPLPEYKLNPDWVDGVFIADVEDVLNLFKHKVDKIYVSGLRLNEQRSYAPHAGNIARCEFVPHTDQYFVKVMETILRWFKGQPI